MKRLESIEDVFSFYDLIEMSVIKYSSCILFKTYDKEWTYQQFYDDVKKTSCFINEIEQPYIRIDIENAYYFCVVLYAAIISCKTVILFENGEYDFSDEIFVIRENIVSTSVLNEKNYKKIVSQINCMMPCIIVKSSGTTSVSKGVMISQNNLIAEIKMLIKFKPFMENEVYFHVLPYSHLFGLLGEFLIPLCTGSTVCFSVNSLELFKNLTIFKPTYMHATPAIIESIVKVLEYTGDIELSTGGRLKTIISGGAHLDEKNRSILNRYGLDVYVAYGLTESTSAISVERDGSTKIGSVGQILPGCNVRIVDGEITVSGETIMMGYWNDQKSTNLAIRDGYLYTGDIGYIDDDGFLHFIGRKSNVIVFESGKKIVPEELENLLNQLTGVEESIVVSKKMNGRTMIDVYIYTNGNSDEEDMNFEIRNVLKRFLELGLLKGIIYNTTPLKRNGLGKINRYYYSELISK